MATEADFDRIGNYALMYNKDQKIDRHQCKRVVPMEVLALGYSRTGTLSMRKAFEILGYADPYHFSSIYGNPRDSDMWMELIDAKFNGKGTLSKEKFDQLLGHVSAVTDIPCILFSKELIEYYPDAKIVLVERDIDSWYQSFTTYLREAMNPFVFLTAPLDPGFLGRVAAIGGAGTSILIGRATSLAAAEARSKEEHRKHYAFVRPIAPKERLLEYKLGDGWEPLCHFLGKSVPEGIPFPKINESVGMKVMFNETLMKGVKNAAKNIVVAMAVVGIPVLVAFKYRGLAR